MSPAATPKSTVCEAVERGALRRAQPVRAAGDGDHHLGGGDEGGVEGVGQRGGVRLHPLAGDVRGERRRGGAQRHRGRERQRDGGVRRHVLFACGRAGRRQVEGGRGRRATGTARTRLGAARARTCRRRTGMLRRRRAGHEQQQHDDDHDGRAEQEDPRAQAQRPALSGFQNAQPPLAQDVALTRNRTRASVRVGSGGDASGVAEFVGDSPRIPSSSPVMCGSDRSTVGSPPGGPPRGPAAPRRPRDPCVPSGSMTA